MAKYDGKNPDAKCACGDKKSDHCGKNGACIANKWDPSAIGRAKACDCKGMRNGSIRIKVGKGTRTVELASSGRRQRVTIFQLGTEASRASRAQMVVFAKALADAYQNPEAVIISACPVKVTQVLL